MCFKFDILKYLMLLVSRGALKVANIKGLMWEKNYVAPLKPRPDERKIFWKHVFSTLSLTVSEVCFRKN